MPGLRPRLPTHSTALSAGLVHTARRVGFRLYHGAVSANYALEVFAPTKATPAGQIRTYELADTHGDDTLLATLEARAGPADVIYDIGAYTGAYALALATEAPDRTIVAFEPNAESARRFETNRRLTAPAGTVDIETLGLGDQERTLRFYHSTFPKLSSFDRADATRWGARIDETERVPSRTLDSLSELPPPDHVKIDVEGHAPAVLRGARETLERHRPVLYVEPHDRPDADRTGEIEVLCEKFGYDIEQRGDWLLCRPADSQTSC